jgi:hypothetical protein
MEALSQIAAFSLVGAIRTVGRSIANGRQVHAPLMDHWALPLTDRTPERWRNAGMLMRLVGIVSAVVDAVANVGFEHTLAVLALEEVVGACN